MTNAQQTPFGRVAALLLIALSGVVGGSAAQDTKKEATPPTETKKEDKPAAAAKDEKKAGDDDKKRRAEDDARRRQEVLAERQAAARAQAAKVAQVQAAAARLVAVQQQRVWPDAQFEQWVFQQDSNATIARTRFEALLTLQVEEIDRVCHLTQAQQQRIRLMGHGDVKRVFDAFDVAKRRFHELNNDMNRLQEVMPDVQPVQTAIQNGLFSDDSLLMKSLRHVLTAEQVAKYAVAVKERRAYRHRAKIELAVSLIEQSLPLRESQRLALTELLVKETKPTRTTNNYYDFYVVMDQVGRLPEDKIKAMFTPGEWKILDRQVGQYRGIVQNWRAAGIIVDDDEVDGWSVMSLEK